MEYVYMLLLMGVVIALCIFINRVTDKLKIPSLLLFIAMGMLFGVLLRPQIGNFTDYGLGNVVCSICLVFVIFYGGFGTNFREAKPVAPQALLLSFAGTALTAGHRRRVRLLRFQAFALLRRRYRLGGEPAHRLGHQLDGRRLRVQHPAHAQAQPQIPHFFPARDGVRLQRPHFVYARLRVHRRAGGAVRGRGEYPLRRGRSSA